MFCPRPPGRELTGGAGRGAGGPGQYRVGCTQGVHTRQRASARVVRGADGVSKPMIGRPMSAERAMRACRAMGEPALSAERGADPAAGSAVIHLQAGVEGRSWPMMAAEGGPRGG